MHHALQPSLAHIKEGRAIVYKGDISNFSKYNFYTGLLKIVVSFGPFQKPLDAIIVSAIITYEISKAKVYKVSGRWTSV